MNHKKINLLGLVAGSLLQIVLNLTLKKVHFDLLVGVLIYFKPSTNLYE